MEREPEITALVYDAKGGSHARSIPMLDEILLDPSGYVSPAELPEIEDITERIALNAIRLRHFNTDLPSRHTKFSL